MSNKSDFLGRSPTTGKAALKRAELMDRINISLPHDRRLWREDIRASKVHAEMLAHCGIISKQEARKLLSGLDKVAAEIKAGKTSFDNQHEDIHMYVEARLHDLIGATAGKLHTARSRNDQVATDVRLYLRGRLHDIDKKLQGLQRALISQAEQHHTTLMPGLTHMQAAQPISFGFHLMAYVEAVGRDRERISDALRRINKSPLGAGALAGTQHKIDRKFSAKKLGFSEPLANAMDAVASRDHLLETLGLLAISAQGLSRLAEELVLWCSSFFGYLKLSDEFSSFSSIMPQKRNPDAAELVRAKSGKILGNFVALAQVVNALPMAYSKDLQEDKPALFESLDEFELMAEVLAEIIATLEVNKANMAKGLSDTDICATDIADFLVSRGMAFRSAYVAVKEIIALKNKGKLTPEALNNIHGELESKLPELLDPNEALKRRASLGSSAPAQVKRQIARAKKLYL